MGTLQIVCGCKKLVKVVDRKIEDHLTQSGEQCLSSGLRYIGQKRKAGAGGPTIEVVAAGEINCPECHEHKAMVALVSVTSPNPSNN